MVHTERGFSVTGLYFSAEEVEVQTIYTVTVHVLNQYFDGFVLSRVFYSGIFFHYILVITVTLVIPLSC